MPKLKNPPPKRVRLTKNLGRETRKFLNRLDFLFTMGRTAFDFDETKRQTWDDLCALRANWNTWWDNEKNKRNERQNGSKG